MASHPPEIRPAQSYTFENPSSESQTLRFASDIRWPCIFRKSASGWVHSDILWVSICVRHRWKPPFLSGLYAETNILYDSHCEKWAFQTTLYFNVLIFFFVKRIHFSFVCRFRNAKAKKIVVLTVTCQAKNGLVCRDFFPTQMLKCTFLILQHRFCIHNGNRKLKLAIVSAANLVLF